MTYVTCDTTRLFFLPVSGDGPLRFDSITITRSVVTLSSICFISQEDLSHPLNIDFNERMWRPFSTFPAG